MAIDKSTAERLTEALQKVQDYCRTHPDDVASWAEEEIGSLLEDVQLIVQDNQPDEGERAQRIRALAAEQYAKDGEIEIDTDAAISEGDDDGAYVQAWVWVDFEATGLDKDVTGEPSNAGQWIDAPLQ